MSTKSLFSLAVLSILLSWRGVCPASDYVVTLVNGETLPVNSYTVKGNRIILVYPLGSAEIALSQVSAVHDGSGKAELLQSKGEPVVNEARVAAHTQYDPLSATSRTEGQSGPQSAVTAKAGSQPAPVPSESRASGIIPAGLRPDPMAAEIDNLIDKYSGADEMQGEAADKELDQAFAAYFDESDTQP